MRRRLTVVIVGVVAASLLVTGVGTIVLVRIQSRQNTRRDVTQLAANVAHTASLVRLPQRLAGLQTVLRRTQDVAVFRIPRQATDRLPRGMTGADLDVAALQQGRSSSGFDRSVAFGIVPFRLANGE